MAASCKDKWCQFLIMITSALVALVLVWFLSQVMLSWVYKFDTKEMVQETIREMVKEDALKKGQ